MTPRSHGFVLLAAGLGTRFGGPKQLAEVGPAGEPLFVLTARQALSSGFGRVVVVTRRSLAPEVEALVRMLLPAEHVEVVLQDGVEPVRAAPWGTAHAVAVGAAALDRPFGVANADDYYGAEAIELLGAAVGDLAPTDAVVMGYRLGDTLSAHGPVNRAECRVDEHGRIVDIRECFGLRRVGDHALDEAGREHALDAPVSMNLFGLGAAVRAGLAERFAAFAPRHAGDADEMVLPDVLASMLADGEIGMRYLDGGRRWGGLTHRADLADLRRVVATDADAHRT